MKRLYKRLTAAGLVVVLGMTGMAVMNTAGCGSSGEGVSSTETGETAADEAYRIAPADLTLWYADDSYADFFTEAAVRYYAKTGKKVAVQYQDTIDYLGTIYDKTMQDDAFPDVYLLPGDNLEEAYLYGLVSVNQTDPSENGVLEKAVEAAAYEERVLGYPLSYDACVFIYQTDYFTEAPASLQAIIDYSNENEPAENVEYLLDSVLASTMLSNSEYIVMLNQAASDRQKLAELLNISNEQMSYITNADAGCGLIKYGSSLVPFVNKFPKDTRLYKLMTTKPGEDYANRSRM